MFALKRPFRRFKTYKDGLFAVFGFLFCLIGLFVANNTCLASYSTGFETPAETAHWDLYSNACGTTTISDLYAKTGSYALRIQDIGCGIGTSYTDSLPLSDNGVVSFWVYGNNTNGAFDIQIADSTTTDYTALVYFNGTTTQNVWTDISIEWKPDKTYKKCISTDCSDWETWPYATGTALGDINFLGGGFGATDMFIDDLSIYSTTFPASTTNYLSIKPTFPPDCVSTIDLNATDTATGYIYNPTSTNQTFYYITMALTDTLTGFSHIATATALVYGIYEQPIYAGQWATYDFDFAIGNSAYYIDYYLEGDIFTFAPQHCYTTIGTATSTARPPIINEPIYTAQEDCSLTTSTADRLLCEIKNFFTGLFFPSGEKVIELQNNLKELNNRFPISYINLWTTFATNLNHETTDIVLITFFEATSSVDFTGMDTTIDYGNQSTGFMERLRNIFSAILIFGFFLWGITFLKRVFK